jgi:hypothetical protein
VDALVCSGHDNGIDFASGIEYAGWTTDMNKALWSLLAAVLLIVHLSLGIDTIRKTAPTFDEHVHLLAGYSYLKGEGFRFNILDHPPLAKAFAAIPLLFLNPGLPSDLDRPTGTPQFQTADEFMYHNTADAETMLTYARLMLLLLSCLLGYMVFRWSSELFGFPSGLITLFLYAFSCHFLGHGTLVTTDVPLACFYTIACFLFSKWICRGTLGLAFCTGLATAVAFAIKFSGILLIPTFVIIGCLLTLKYRVKSDSVYPNATVFCVTVLLTLLVIYQFTHLSLYVAGLSHLSKSFEIGQSTFLLGHHSEKGWLYYFAIAFILKTPLALLILLITTFVARKRKWLTTDNLCLIAPPVIFFIFASFATRQLGLRHIFPIYPFLFILASSCLQSLQKGVVKMPRYLQVSLISILLAWYGISCVKIHPWHISYFNEIVGDPANGYKYLVDSNVDWGQGLKELGKWYQSNYLNGIYLCYFGTADPHYYGIRFVSKLSVTAIPQRAVPGDAVATDPGGKNLFAISATNMQSIYYKNKNLFDWLKKEKAIQNIAFSIFVFDLTKRPDLQNKLLLLKDGN